MPSPRPICSSSSGITVATPLSPTSPLTSSYSVLISRAWSWSIKPTHNQAFLLHKTFKYFPVQLAKKAQTPYKDLKNLHPSPLHHVHPVSFLLHPAPPHPLASGAWTSTSAHGTFFKTSRLPLPYVGILTYKKTFTPVCGQIIRKVGEFLLPLNCLKHGLFQDAQLTHAEEIGPIYNRSSGPSTTSPQISQSLNLLLPARSRSVGSCSGSCCLNWTPNSPS